MTLYPHQLPFQKGYKGPSILAHSTGTGKTVCAALWLKDGRDRDALVVCPKRVVEKWKSELKKWGTKATVVSKENFKKMKHKRWSAIVIDEAHNHGAPLFIAKQRSQLAFHTYELLRINEKTPRLLLSATPISSAPHNLHTLICYTGKHIPWKDWREHFYELTRRPYLPGLTWIPKANWRQLIRPVLQKYASIVTLADVVKEMPEEKHTIVYTKAPPFVPTEWAPGARFHEECRNEQKGKLSAILEASEGYRKVLVSAHYLEQCADLYRELGKHRETFLITGATKGQEYVIRDANASDECFLIFQGSLGEGWEAPTFEALIFASMPFGVRNYVQAKGRIRRVNALHDVEYIHIIGGDCDKVVYDTVQAGKTFVPEEYATTTQKKKNKGS